MASPRSRRESADYYRDRRRRKVCNFCVDKAESIDYKEVNRLRRYLSERAKIEPRRKTGTCARHQRMLTTALKPMRDHAMQTYFPLHQLGAKRRQKRQNRLKQLVSAAVGLLAAVGVSLVFGFAMELPDAQWAEAWTGLGHAYSLLD